MANHASAEKRNRQRVKKTLRNRAGKSELRTSIKKARTTLKDSPKDASSVVAAAASALDRAASKGIIPSKRASRVKSRLAKALHKAAATTPAS